MLYSQPFLFHPHKNNFLVQRELGELPLLRLYAGIRKNKLEIICDGYEQDHVLLLRHLAEVTAARRNER